MNSLLLLVMIFVSESTFVSASLSVGTLTNEFGRISNMVNDQIHVSSSVTLSDCIRQCADFSQDYPEYYDEDCFAYNFDIRQDTCELIHSKQPMSYSISFQTQWMTGLKSPA